MQHGQDREVVLGHGVFVFKPEVEQIPENNQPVAIGLDQFTQLADSGYFFSFLPLRYESIYIARSTPYDIDQLRADIDELLHSSDVIAKLQQIVPEYVPQRDNA